MPNNFSCKYEHKNSNEPPNKADSMKIIRIFFLFTRHMVKMATPNPYTGLKGPYKTPALLVILCSTIKPNIVSTKTPATDPMIKIQNS